MQKYASDAPAGGTSPVAAEDSGDERSSHPTSGAVRSALIVCAVGALLLLIGTAAMTRSIASAFVPPWVAAVGWSTSAFAAVAAMAITARLLARSAAVARHDPPVHENAHIPATATPSSWSRPAAERPPPITRFQIDIRGGRRMVAASEVEWIEASGNYARLHTAADALLYRMPLSRLEQQLEPQRFLRIHRSAIVNLDRIRRIEPLSSGDAVLHLNSGASVRMSRRYARAFHAVTGRGSRGRGTRSAEWPI